jgi:hypothetical protein
MDNLEKLATCTQTGTQDDEKQNKNTTQHVLGHYYTQTNINNINKIRALLQTTGAKTNRTSVFYAEIVTDVSQHGTQNNEINAK